MRILLSLIISSFFFIAPFQGNARDIPGKLLIVNIENKTPGTELIAYSLTDRPAEADILFNQIRNSISQYRFHTYINFNYKVDFIGRIKSLPGKKNFIQPYLYCKPIGLKLVFPQHYYW